MSTITPREPILLELGDDAWKDHLDQVETWLKNVLFAQAAFRQLAEDTAGKIRDPRVKEQLVCIADTAKEHEQRIDELFQVIGREPANIRKTGGTIYARGVEGVADVLGMMGGAAGAWRDLRQLVLVNLNTIGAFGVVEQLGLALGMPKLVEIAFEVVRDKSTQQLLMQEYLLELAPIAVLYDQEI